MTQRVRFLWFIKTKLGADSIASGWPDGRYWEDLWSDGEKI